MSTTITIEQAKKDGNSSVNQTIKGKFVEREVLCNVNSLMEYSLRQSFENNDAPFTYDDIDNYYTPVEGQYKLIIDNDSEEDFDARIEDEQGDTLYTITKEIADKIRLGDLDPSNTNDVVTYLANNNIMSIDKLLEENDDFETEASEIYEWYAITGWFAEKLKDKGHPVITGYHNYWGRCTTGQAILLDYVITDICADMGILDGQENSWADKK